MTKYNEPEDLLGRRGEELAMRIFKRNGWRVSDKRYAPSYQDRDIDFTVYAPFGVRTVEIKTNSDKHTYNIFIELTHINKRTGETENGWWNYCESDILGFAVGGVLHLVPRKALVEYHKKYTHDIKYTGFSSGYCIPIWLIQTMKGYEKYEIREEIERWKKESECIA